MWIPKWVVQQHHAMVERLQEDLRKAYERIDRLTEAVARKNDSPFHMPQAELPKVQQQIVPEPCPGWHDLKPFPQMSNSGGSKK